jgi:hypothetical protein
MIFKIQTQIISMDSSQCPLSMRVSLLCENRIHPFIRGIRSDRSDLETTLLKGRVASPGGNPFWHVLEYVEGMQI